MPSLEMCVIFRVNSLIPIQFVFVCDSNVCRKSANQLKIASARCANICEWCSLALSLFIYYCYFESVNSFEHKYSLAKSKSPNRTTDNEYFKRNPRMPMQPMHVPHRKWLNTHSQHTMRLKEPRNNSGFSQFHNMHWNSIRPILDWWPAAAGHSCTSTQKQRRNNS